MTQLEDKAAVWIYPAAPQLPVLAIASLPALASSADQGQNQHPHLECKGGMIFFPSIFPCPLRLMLVIL